MKSIQGIEFHTGSREERLPGFADDFPYIASRVELDKYIGRSVPWHWHRAVEIFYMESGAFECYTPGGKILFPKGSGCMVNSNILHMTKAAGKTEKNIPLVHLFDTSLIAGEQGSRIGRKYILPIVASPQIEMLPLFPENPDHKNILDCIFEAFFIPENEFGYEVKLQEALLGIWLMLYKQYRPMLDEGRQYNRNNDKVKQMMVYVHEHYPERITIKQLAETAYLSERECFRVFHDCLHMTPAEYIKNYRLQMACQMLAKGKESITEISQACGLGSSSYMGRVFKGYANCTPLEYRRRWQDCDIQGQK